MEMSKSEDVEWFARQGDSGSDNLLSLMPVTIYRVTWIDSKGERCEFLTRSYQAAFDRKYEIDHSNGEEEYLNFESWFAYRSREHDRQFGRINREKGWWK